MAIHAQLRPQRAAGGRAAERPARGLGARRPGICGDASELLDRRPPSRRVPRRLAPPGRYLEVGHGDETHLIALDRPIVHIGRDLPADVRLEDPQVSRRHAVIAQRGDGARVFDQGSRNGTFVNGRRVRVAYLADGDVVRLGPVGFCFIEIEPERNAAPPLRRLGLAVSARLSATNDARTDAAA